MLSATIET